MSDLHIALEGITEAEQFLELLGKAEALTSFPLDLVQREKIDPVFARRNREKGVLLYEHPCEGRRPHR